MHTYFAILSTVLLRGQDLFYLNMKHIMFLLLRTLKLEFDVQNLSDKISSSQLLLKTLTSVPSLTQYFQQQTLF